MSGNRNRNGRDGFMVRESLVMSKEELEEEIMSQIMPLPSPSTDVGHVGQGGGGGGGGGETRGRRHQGGGHGQGRTKPTVLSPFATVGPDLRGTYVNTGSMSSISSSLTTSINSGLNNSSGSAWPKGKVKKYKSSNHSSSAFLARASTAGRIEGLRRRSGRLKDESAYVARDGSAGDATRVGEDIRRLSLPFGSLQEDGRLLRKQSLYPCVRSLTEEIIHTTIPHIARHAGSGSENDGDGRSLVDNVPPLMPYAAHHAGKDKDLMHQLDSSDITTTTCAETKSLSDSGSFFHGSARLSSNSSSSFLVEGSSSSQYEMNSTCHSSASSLATNRSRASAYTNPYHGYDRSGNKYQDRFDHQSSNNVSTWSGRYDSHPQLDFGVDDGLVPPAATQAFQPLEVRQSQMHSRPFSYPRRHYHHRIRGHERLVEEEDNYHEEEDEEEDEHGDMDMSSSREVSLRLEDLCHKSFGVQARSRCSPILSSPPSPHSPRSSMRGSSRSPPLLEPPNSPPNSRSSRSNDGSHPSTRSSRSPPVIITSTSPKSSSRSLNMASSSPRSSSRRLDARERLQHGPDLGEPGHYMSDSSSSGSTSKEHHHRHGLRGRFRIVNLHTGSRSMPSVYGDCRGSGGESSPRSWETYPFDNAHSASLRDRMRHRSPRDILPSTMSGRLHEPGRSFVPEAPYMYRRQPNLPSALGNRDDSYGNGTRDLRTTTDYPKCPPAPAIYCSGRGQEQQDRICQSMRRLQQEEEHSRRILQQEEEHSRRRLQQEEQSRRRLQQEQEVSHSRRRLLQPEELSSGQPYRRNEEQDDKEYIDIGPGIKERLRSPKETKTAIINDFYVPKVCYGCSLDLFCIKDVLYFICPVCKVISPMEDEEPNDQESHYESSRIPAKRHHGVGLGFTFEKLFEMQAEIMQEQNS